NEIFSKSAKWTIGHCVRYRTGTSPEDKEPRHALPSTLCISRRYGARNIFHAPRPESRRERTRARDSRVGTGSQHAYGLDSSQQANLEIKGPVGRPQGSGELDSDGGERQSAPRRLHFDGPR